MRSMFVLMLVIAYFTSSAAFRSALPMRQQSRNQVPSSAWSAVVAPIRTSSSGSSGVSSFQLAMSSKEKDFYAGQDNYSVLGVDKQATQKDIKSAYRKQIAKWHPDKFPDDDVKQKEGGTRMERINRAWYCLGDDDRRKRYDTYGEQGVGSSAASEEQLKQAGGPGMGGGMGGGGGFGGNGGAVDVSDIFDAFFGGQGGGRPGGGGGGGGRQQSSQKRNANAPVPGDDLSIEVEIPFMTAIFGGQETMKVRRLEECNTCTGNGIKPGSSVKSCSVCAGQGVVNNMQRTPFGVFNNVQTCPNCRGSGQEVEEYCPTCKGRGANSESKEVNFKVPTGIDPGTTMRVRDAGNSGRRGGPRGDLFVTLMVKKDKTFTRQGTEIYTEEEISYPEAILGTMIMADTIEGKTEVKIPPGTQPEQRLRLRGKGAPKLGTDARGDQYITIKVKIPSSVSGKEKELVEQISVIVDAKRGAKNEKKGGFFSNFGGD